MENDSFVQSVFFNMRLFSFLRAGGFMSLENLIYLAKNYPVTYLYNFHLLHNLRGTIYLIFSSFLAQSSFWRLLHKQDGKRAEWEYPFAVAGVNITHMLMQMLDLQSGKTVTNNI